MGRRSKIQDEGEFVQGNMFATLVTPKAPKFSAYPKLSTDVEDFRRILRDSEGPLGCDFEFQPNYYATHLGIATADEAVCVRSSPALISEMVEDVKRKGRTLVGHSVIGAEREVIRVATGEKLELKYLDDTMLSHHLMNADLCGLAQKKEDEDDKGSLGFMGLNSMAHLQTMLPAWKSCAGRDCSEAVCPKHSKSLYCAVDAWASLNGHTELMEEMETYGVHHWYYREKVELAELAQDMQDQGIRVDREYVARFEAESEERKAALFPFQTKGKERVYSIFNPRSPEQVLSYFKQNGINLASVNKKDVRKALEARAEKHGYTIQDLEAVTDTVPEVLQNLYHLDLFKTQGKGLDSWFADKYLDREGFLHPRFVVTGTATDRWSSSRPNLTNVPSHGSWGSMVKQALIPRAEGLEIADVDASQLEFRNILFQLGWDAKDIPPKVFEFLVEKSNGGFKQTAEFLEQDERQIAKTVVYGSLYGEGMSVLSPYDLERSNIKSEITFGARKVYLKKFGAPFDWTFNDHVVTFTGGNMAERLFRDKTYESRRKALFLTEDVLMSTFDIRRWQKAVSDEVEAKGYVQCPYTGKILRMYGSIEDQIKPALSARGQGCSAVHVQGVMLRFKREMGLTPLITVHDSAVIEFPKEWSDKKLSEHLRFMVEDTHRIPGFFTPAGIKRGPNYGQLRKVSV